MFVYNQLKLNRMNYKLSLHLLSHLQTDVNSVQFGFGVQN